MSQLLAGTQGADLSVLGSALTVAFVTCFLTWTWWAWRPANAARHAAAALLPFETVPTDPRGSHE